MAVAMNDRAVTLDEAGPGDAELLGNLLQLYIHDLSAIFTHVELGSDGRFGYPHLGSYFDGRDGRYAFLIREAGELAGFILVKRGSPFFDDPQIFDIAEFFVLRRHRGRGVGRLAAALLWQRLPGRWSVRVALENADAVPFWRRTISAYTGAKAEEQARHSGEHAWAVFDLEAS
jgi:predicted acetyltransferase